LASRGYDIDLATFGDDVQSAIVPAQLGAENISDTHHLVSVPL
jgi:hypothetical protein